MSDDTKHGAADIPIGPHGSTQPRTVDGITTYYNTLLREWRWWNEETDEGGPLGWNPDA